MFNRNFKFSVAVILLVTNQVVLAQSSNTSNITNNKVNHSTAKYKHVLSNKNIKLVEGINRVGKTARTKEYQGLKRDEVKSSRQKLARSNTLAKTNQHNTRANLHHSFSIYNGYSELLTDIDADGYYQTFSVSFDADVLSPFINEQALVYADLYLSQNGGPWILYFSTDNFTITGESTEDEFEVITNLESGYAPDSYDVLIDLYEVGFSDVVATYSSDDTNALYALPLESSDYDPEYIEVEYYDEHGGSFGGASLLFFLLIMTRRR